MGDVDSRSITLSPELAAAVDDVVAAGAAASAVLSSANIWFSTATAPRRWKSFVPHCHHDIHSGVVEG